MTTIQTSTTQQHFPRTIAFACTLLTILLLALRAESAVLPLGDEQDGWSDMLLPPAIGTFDSGFLTISTNAGPTDLELGSPFGPSNPGWHYGTTGTLGGTFSASLGIVRLQIAPNGAVVSGDNSIVTIAFAGGSAGSLGTDYGIGNGRALVRGIVREVLLDATGDNTLDIFFTITGGDLQELPNPDPTIGIFAPNKLGLFRIAAPNLPSNWTSNFSFTGATVHAFGLVPEPSALLLALAACPLAARLRRSR